MDVANDEHLKTTGCLIDPPKEDEILVTYPDTLDGFLAAWVVRKIAREKNIALEMIHTPPADIDLTGRNWILIGGSIDPAEIGSTPKSGLLIRAGLVPDVIAPLPFKDWKRTFPYGIATMVKSNVWGEVRGTSLAKATWDFFHADTSIALAKLPRLLDYFNDSVTDNRYGDTADVVACIESYTRNFQVFDKLVEASDDRKRLAYVIAAGQAVRRYKELNGL